MMGVRWINILVICQLPYLPSVAFDWFVKSERLGLKRFNISLPLFTIPLKKSPMPPAISVGSSPFFMMSNH